MSKKVLITVPTAPSNMYIHKECVFVLLQLSADPRYETRIVLPSYNPFENNLHHCVNMFLAKDYDYWLSFDSDNPPLKNPLDLIEYDRDIMGCPTPLWHYTGKKGERPIYHGGYDYVPEEDAYSEHKEREGLQRVDAISTSCFLIAKRVFLDKEMQKGAFTRKLNEDGTVAKGNDLSFCERAKEQGFEIFSHYDYPCNHFKTIPLNDVLRVLSEWRNDG